MDDRELEIKQSEREIHDNPIDGRKNWVDLADERHNAELQDHGAVGWFEAYLHEYTTGTVLDVACGDARWARQLFDRRTDGSITYYGVDISRERVAETGARYANDDADFYLSDGEYLPFETSSFDTVITSAALHHLPNWDSKALDEIQRVMKPDGNLVFREPLKYNPLVAAYRRLFPCECHTPHEHPFSPFELRRELERRFEELDWKGHYLVAPLIPFLDNHLPIDIPAAVSKRVYDAERALIDNTTVAVCHQVTGVARTPKQA